MVHFIQSGIDRVSRPILSPGLRAAKTASTFRGVVTGAF